MESVLHALSGLTPVGLAGLCALLVYGLLSKRSPIRQMKDNHLEHIQASLARIADNSDKQLEHLDAIKVDMAIVKDRLPR